VPDPITSDTFGQGRRAIYEPPAPAPPPRARGGRFLLVGLPLIAVFAAFGSIMWLAYVDATPGSASRQPPLIRAEATPLKVDPDDPGGRAVADQGELRGLIGDVELSREPERLLPPPEEPVTPPEATPSTPAVDGAPSAQDRQQATADATRSELPGSEGQTGAGAASSRDTEAEASAALDALLAEVTRPGQPADSQPGAAAEAQPRDLAPPDPASPPASEQEAPTATGDGGAAAIDPPAAPDLPPAAARERDAIAALDADRTLAPDVETRATPAPAPAAVPSTDLRVVAAPGDTQVAAADATYRIQLAAVRDESDARRAWGLFQNSLGDVVGGLDPIIERADTANGTFYRVQVGPFANLAAAESLCEQLKQRNASCFVIRR
jgi:SPOR domain